MKIVLEYLSSTDIEPFNILSDINISRLSGMELREKIHENEDLRLKSITCLFFTISTEQKHVVVAYSKSIQGFFVKPADYTAIKEIIKTIAGYWQSCVSPNYIK